MIFNHKLSAPPKELQYKNCYKDKIYKYNKQTNTIEEYYMLSLYCNSLPKDLLENQEE